MRNSLCPEGNSLPRSEVRSGLEVIKGLASSWLTLGTDVWEELRYRSTGGGPTWDLQTPQLSTELAHPGPLSHTPSGLETGAKEGNLLAPLCPCHNSVSNPLAFLHYLFPQGDLAWGLIVPQGMLTAVLMLGRKPTDGPREELVKINGRGSSLVV